MSISWFRERASNSKTLAFWRKPTSGIELRSIAPQPSGLTTQLHFCKKSVKYWLSQAEVRQGTPTGMPTLGQKIGKGYANTRPKGRPNGVDHVFLSPFVKRRHSMSQINDCTCAVLFFCYFSQV